ncbi:MAG: tRNA uridine-5-carboxymethylaminomethyl(34) synthesis enzyme MnmG, partial [Proteobacteria bacterium]|nr:tRNA uridine-5-carboxymethylaminomethyl(34) synthesis enzyme MnmG [Pseudomonadota bacterium]
IEDKIMRFANKNSHQIFVEPEGLHTTELYPNGISTSLPFDVQIQFIRSIKGFENVHVTRPGYAIEYDFFDPRGLNNSLETKYVKNLFFAGQINGTTGYEEAAAQGLIAGLNAALKVANKPAYCPARSEAYIGVMIDDLITKGTQEPYRMFTSRAEYRLLLREDNADMRLTPKAHALGLIDEHRWNLFNAKKQTLKTELKHLKSVWLSPNNDCGRAFKDTYPGIPLNKEVSAFDLLRRPEINYSMLATQAGLTTNLSDIKIIEQLEIHAQYAGYMQRQLAEIEKCKAQENKIIPTEFSYQSVRGLSAELTEKLTLIKPQTVGQATRIQGMTPAAVSLLLVHLKRDTTQTPTERNLDSK